MASSERVGVCICAFCFGLYAVIRLRVWDWEIVCLAVLSVKSFGAFV